jgi:cell division protein FtsA
MSHADDLSLLGTGHGASRGLWEGQITGFHALTEALTKVIYETEQHANMQVREATVSLSGAFFTSDYCAFRTPITDRTVTDRTLRNLIHSIVHPHLSPIHIVPLEFWVDQQHNITDPRGMIGKELGGHFHVLWMNTGRYQTLFSCLKSCQVRVTDLVFSGYASALACLDPDEQELGVTLIDIGASSTSLTFFMHQKMVGVSVIPFGGHAITQDIARVFETPIMHAERIKILYGAAFMSAQDLHETIPILTMGERETTTKAQRSLLIHVIQARSEELCALFKKSMEASKFPIACQRIVFTGGGSQLLGLKELAQRVLKGSIRMAKPKILPGAPKSSGEFSSVIGTLLHPQHSENLSIHRPSKPGFLSWLKETVFRS